MKNNKWLIIFLAIAVILLVVAIVFKGKSKPKGIEVEIETAAQRTIIEKVAASGKIFPETEVKISSDVSGEITELYVQEGDSVVIGQLLAKIDPEVFSSAVEQGEAGLNQSKSALANAQSQIENSRGGREQVIATLENARIVHNRNVELYADGVISQVEFDQSLLTLKQQEANLKSAEASIRAAEKSAEGARYQVKSSEANLKQLRTNLSRTSIKAPTSGIVSSLSVEQGERVVGTIQMTGTEMMRIANLNSMEVQVDVSENDILRVNEGDEVDIEVDAYLDKVFKGVVTEIANSASNIQTASLQLNSDQVTNFIVKIRIDPTSYENLNAEGQKYPFRPGMSASTDIYTERVEDVLSVPIQAVTIREKEDENDKKGSDKNQEVTEEDLLEVVFVMEADTARMVEVVSGIQDDDYIVVKAGISEGDEVIVGPYQAVSKKLEDGKSVYKKEDEDEKDD